jgi:branched-chain amino acid transport system ATP-binding protein
VRPSPRAIPAVLVGVLGAGAFLLLPGYLLYAGSTALVSGLIGLGLFLPIAALREMPLNAAGIAGLAAYLFAHSATGGGVGAHVTGILLGLGVAVGLSVLTGLGSLVVTGLYFVVASLVVQVGIEKVVFSIPGVTGGAAGWSVAQPELSGWFDTQRAVYVITAAIVLVLALTVRATLGSRLGFRTVLVGHVPEGASSMGLRNWAIKLLVFAMSGLLIGIGGLLVAFVNGAPPPVFSFGLIFSVIYVAIPIASGMRELSSIWLVAAAFTAVPILLEPLHLFPNLISGAILVAALALGQNRERLAARARRLRMGAVEVELEGRAAVDGPPLSRIALPSPELRALTAAAAAALEGRDITVDFGGIRAVDAVGVRVAPGERVGIVGANGAGKTTLINALTGFVPLHEGTVLLGGHDITAWSPMRRARAGIRRSFQFPRLADVLTAEQNVVAVHGMDPRRDERLDMLLAAFGLDGLRSTPAGALSFGQRRKLELVRALATRPQVLVLDEPSGGLTDEQGERLSEVLLELQARDGWGLLVIEHNPRVLTALSRHLLVLENGRLLVEGPTATTIHEEEVRRVYLGRRVDARRPLRTSAPTPAADPAAPRVSVTSDFKGGPVTGVGGLIVRDLQLRYGPMPVLRGVSLDCRPQKVVGVVGGNGVGKTSLLAGIAGLVPASAGTVHLDGRDLSRWPGYRRGQAGMVMVAERRRVLPSLSVRDNLCAGGWGLDRDEVEARVDRVLELFPRIAQRLSVPSYRLSGGEQRMVSIGRALVTGARCLLFDELSLSLSPQMVGELTTIVRALADEGRIVLLVEQYIGALLEIADTVHVLERGRFAFGGPAGAAAEWLEEHGYLARAEALAT